MQHKTKREQLSTKMRKATLFRYRIVVTLPPWGVLVMAGAIAFGLLVKPMLVTNIVSVTAVLVAVVLVFVARRAVRALRFEVHEALNNIGNDDIDLTEYEPQSEMITLKKLDHTNGSRSTRISE